MKLVYCLTEHPITCNTQNLCSLSSFVSTQLIDLFRLLLFISMISSINFIRQTQQSRGFERWFHVLLFATIYPTREHNQFLMLSFRYSFSIWVMFVICLFYWWENSINDKFEIKTKFTIKKISEPKKQIELIKHTFTNKLASTLTHARYGGCRCRRRQGIISRKAIWNRKETRRGIRQTQVKDAIRTTITIRIGGTIHRTKYFKWRLMLVLLTSNMFPFLIPLAKCSAGARHSTFLQSGGAAAWLERRVPPRAR